MESIVDSTLFQAWWQIYLVRVVVEVPRYLIRADVLRDEFPGESFRERDVLGGQVDKVSRSEGRGSTMSVGIPSLFDTSGQYTIVCRHDCVFQSLSECTYAWEFGGSR